MPTSHGVEVHVADSIGRPLAEYGTVEKEDYCLTTCYIKSETDKQFTVTITPTFRLWVRASGHQPNISEARPDFLAHTAPWPAWDLRAVVRFDGNPVEERSTFIIIDPRDSLNAQPRSRVLMDGGLRNEGDHSLVEYSWFFQDAPIEVVLSRLNLADSRDSSVAELARDLETLNVEEAGEKVSVGEIEVTLERVRLTRPVTERHFQARQDRDDDIEMEVVDTNIISHTAGRRDERTRSSTVHGWRWEPYMAGEAPWMVFKFWYRDDKILRKHGLIE